DRTFSFPSSLRMPDEREMNRGPLRLAAGPIELLQDRDRLATQLGVLAAPVRLRELSLLAVELGVADLAVLGLLSRLERGDHRVLRQRRGGARLALGAPQGHGDEPRNRGD